MAEQVYPSALREDVALGEYGLGLDSLEVVQLIFACEDRWGMRASEGLFTAPPLTIERVAREFSADETCSSQPLDGLAGEALATSELRCRVGSRRADHNARPFQAPAYFRRRVMANAAWLPSRRWPFPCQVIGGDLGSLRPPMILVSFHTGGIMALRLLFEQLPGKVLVLSFNAVFYHRLRESSG